EIQQKPPDVVASGQQIVRRKKCEHGVVPEKDAVRSATRRDRPPVREEETRSRSRLTPSFDGEKANQYERREQCHGCVIDVRSQQVVAEEQGREAEVGKGPRQPARQQTLESSADATLPEQKDECRSHAEAEEIGMREDAPVEYAVPVRRRSALRAVHVDSDENLADCAEQEHEEHR